MHGTNTARLMIEMQSRQAPATAADLVEAARVDIAPNARGRTLIALEEAGLVDRIHGHTSRWVVTPKGAAWRSPVCPALPGADEREARFRVVSELRSEGFTNAEIADAFGISTSAASQILHDPDGARLGKRHARRKTSACACCGKAMLAENASRSRVRTGCAKGAGSRARRGLCMECVTGVRTDTRLPPRDCDSCGRPQSLYRHPDEVVCGPCAHTAGRPVTTSGRLDGRRSTATTAPMPVFMTRRRSSIDTRSEMAA